MSDLIERQKALDAIQQRADRVDSVYSAFWEGLIIAQDIVQNVPSAEPERKKGKWIDVMNGRGGHCCNRCNAYAPSYKNGDEYLSDFCPNCGADMRGER